MEENQIATTNKKYHPFLCHLLGLYRLFGLICFDNHGRTNRKLQIYSTIILTLQSTTLATAIVYIQITQKHSESNVITNIPLKVRAITHVLHYIVSVRLFFRNNEFLTRTFADIEQIRATLAINDLALLRIAKQIRIFSYFVSILLTIVGVLYVEAGKYEFYFKLILFLSFSCGFGTYLREEVVLVYLCFVKLALEAVNKKLRSSKPTARSIKGLRSVHNELSLLTMRMSDVFEPLVTTMVALTGIDTWAEAFVLIRQIIATGGDGQYRMLGDVWVLAYQFFKITFMCQLCEKIQQQVKKYL